MNALHERVAEYGAKALSTGELYRAVLGRSVDDRVDLASLVGVTPDVLRIECGLSMASAVRLAAALELGARAVTKAPRRGERVLDPARVHDLLREESLAARECFFTVMLDVRGRLLGVEKTAEGSLTQCPVSPRDALRPAVRAGAHGVVFCHNHPSGDPAPSPEDFDLTERLRAAAELVGLVARDHVIVASGGYYSFVAAGRWRR